MSSHADRLQGCANLVSTSIQMLTEHFANQHSAEGSRLTDTEASALLTALGLASKELEQIAQVLSEQESSPPQPATGRTQPRPWDRPWETRRNV